MASPREISNLPDEHSKRFAELYEVKQQTRIDESSEVHAKASIAIDNSVFFNQYDIVFGTLVRNAPIAAFSKQAEANPAIFSRGIFPSIDTERLHQQKDHVEKVKEDIQERLGQTQSPDDLRQLDDEEHHATVIGQAFDLLLHLESIHFTMEGRRIGVRRG